MTHEESFRCPISERPDEAGRNVAQIERPDGATYDGSAIADRPEGSSVQFLPASLIQGIPSSKSVH
jgi:hypothetical protein